MKIQLRSIQSKFRITLLLLLLLSPLSTVQAATQVVELRYGWNMISLSVTPDDPSVGAIFAPIADKFESVWKIDPIQQEWYSFPPPIVGMDSVDELEVGKGYWVKVANSVTLQIEGLDTPPEGDLVLYPGWNMVGFPITEDTDYTNLLTGVPYSQVYSFDVDSGEFKGIELIPGTQTVTKEDFTRIEPGMGYWIYATEQVTLGPVLSTSLHGDVDQEPLLPEGEYGERVLWDEFSSGDEDIGEDGWYDRSNTQRSLTFSDNQNEQQIIIYNKGTGVLRWTAEIVDSSEVPWLKIQSEDLDGEITLVTSISGEQAQTTSYITLQVDRTRLAPLKEGYQATIRLTSNGTSGTEQEERFIQVLMEVPNIVGDYNVLVKIETINDKEADMHNPRLYLSLYEDNDGVKGIIDHSRSLLMSRRFYLSGVYVEDGSNQFTLSGSIVLPPKDSGLDGSDLNPYQVELQREITLIGTRSEPTDANLNALDLKGEYRETIRNVLPEPIYLSGTFEAIRTQKTPLVTDQVIVETNGDVIPDNTGPTEYELVVEDNILITEVDVTVNLTHTRKEDLIVKLISPYNTPVRLREHSSQQVGEMIYDTTAVPIDSMDNFTGELAGGTWKLVVEDDVAGESGSLIAWSLDIKGTKVFSIKGSITGVPDGATVMLTGCGIVKAVQALNGQYQFDNLIDCRYQITVIHPGYEQYERFVLLSGGDLAEIDLTPEKRVSPTPDFIATPKFGQKPFTIQLIDITDLDEAETYIHNWSIYQHNDANVDLYHSIDGQGGDVSYQIPDAGVYHVKLEIANANDPGTILHSIDKTEDFVIVGNSNYGAADSLPTSQQKVMEHYLTSGSAGRTNATRSLYQWDSATFDIDRLPTAEAEVPGLEDTDAFLGDGDGIDPITGTNILAVTPNSVIDPPLGENSVKIEVSIGQPIVGSVVSGNMKMHIGTLQP